MRGATGRRCRGARARRDLEGVLELVEGWCRGTSNPRLTKGACLGCGQRSQAHQLGPGHGSLLSFHSLPNSARTWETHSTRSLVSIFLSDLGP